jgi:predicted nucleic acid-binding protein
VKLGERVLVDASVAVKWVVQEPGSEAAVLLLDRRLVAPDLSCAECANILWKKVVRRELTPDEADVAAQALEGADVEILPTRPHLAAATVLAARIEHSAYDCVYLVAAERADVMMVTADERLVRKLRQSAHSLGERTLALSEVPDAM